MVNKVSRRVFGTGVVATGLIGKSVASFAQETPKRGGTLVATWGGGEPQACYVPARAGGPPPLPPPPAVRRRGPPTPPARLACAPAGALRPRAPLPARQ